MFAAGKGERPQSDNCLHMGKGAFVYHDRLWFCLVYYWSPQGPPSPLASGHSMMHILVVDGKGGTGASRITHSHRIACGMGQLLFTGNSVGRGIWVAFWGHGLLHGMDGRKGRRHGTNFVAWVGSVAFLMRNSLVLSSG